MVLDQLPVPGPPTIWITVGQGPTALTVVRYGLGLSGHFYSHLSFLSSFSLPLGDGPIYAEILSQGPLNPKQPTNQSHLSFLSPFWGWSGGAMVLCKLPVPGRPTILITVGQGPIALAVGAGGGRLDIFTLTCPFSSFSLSLGDGPI